MEIPIQLPTGGLVEGSTPVVVIGPNGSGKTRQTRNLTAPATVEFVNALRNTRVAPELPAVGLETARSQFSQQKEQSRVQSWELASEFDYMLSQLLGQYSGAAIDFQEAVTADPTAAAAGPAVTPLMRVQQVWAEIFPGRKIHWKDWRPVVDSTTSGMSVQYSGNTMSDGEKAALYLLGRVFSFEGGVLVVDEPETHFHSLLAVRLWNALEAARPDVRFVYVTHDLTFAVSRGNATYVLANPTLGLRVIAAGEDLPDDVAGTLLGSASLSFYASRIVFCEGTEQSYDARLFAAWFSGPDTVVRPVASGQTVMRCVTALQGTGIAKSLTATGIIDRDYYADGFLGSLPAGVTALPVHEIESLLSLPGIVEAVSTHMSRAFEESAYLAALKGAIQDHIVRATIINRWKAVVEPRLSALLANSEKGKTSIEDLVDALPVIFDESTWSFSPQLILAEQKSLVELALAGDDTDLLLRLFPGKPLLDVAARFCGMDKEAYVNLLTSTLSNRESSTLQDSLVRALTPKLPARSVPAQMAG